MERLIIEKPGKIGFTEFQIKSLGDNQALAKTLYSGLSHGTEMHAYRGLDTSSYPCGTGYSNVGEIVEVGNNVKNASIGDLVFAYSGHATYFAVDDTNLFKLPVGLTPQAGVFLALLGVAYNGILEARIVLGETVVAFGLGVVGQLVCQLARLSGAGQIIGVDPIELRRQKAKEFVADFIFDPTKVDVAKEVKNLTEGLGADIAIESSGVTSALNEAIKVVRMYSPVVVLSWYSGGSPDLYLGREFHFNKIKLLQAQGGGVNPELLARWTHERKIKSSLAIMPKLRLNELITHVINFADAQIAYDLVDKNPEETIQVVLKY